MTPSPFSKTIGVAQVLRRLYAEARKQHVSIVRDFLPCYAPMAAAKS
jgi:hypothetical protein